MLDKLDLLERSLCASVEESEQAGHGTTIDRRLTDGRLNIERRWQGQLRWIYVTAVDDPALADAGLDYALFLGWYSDPPGDVFWEGRRIGTLAQAKELVALWVLQGASPEALPSWQ